MTTRCDCCDLPTESCGKSIEQAQRKADASRVSGMMQRGYVQAQFFSKCSECGDSINKGDPIKMSADGWACGSHE